MADIRSFYEYIDQQAHTGAVRLSREGEFGIPRILERFSLEGISLEKPELSSLDLNGFGLTGTMEEGGHSYLCTMTVTAGAEDYDCTLRARLSQNGDILLNEVYPPALAYAALNFYSAPVNLFEHVWLREAVLAADTKENTEVPLLSLTLYYEEDCPLYKNYGDFLPEAGETVVLTGDAREPFGEMKYVVEGTFLKRIELPFYGEIKTAEECALVINSHVTEEGREKDGEAVYQCRVGVKFCVPISGISGQGVWMSIDFGDFGESYQLYVNFDDGISLDNAADFIASMTGKSGLPDFPEWTSFGKTPLVGIMMTIERAQSVEMWKTDLLEDRIYSQGLLRTQNGDRLMGCAFYFSLDLPDIPIPFFDRGQGGARAELTVQWNMLNIGGFLAIVAGFHGVWKNHDLKVNITVPDLEIRGIYEQEMGKETANGIFPGFLDLTVRYIRLHGYLPEKAYELDFELVNRNLPVLPIGAHLFQIDTIAGRAEYSPKGLQLAVTMEFTLLTAVLVLEGIYEKGEEGQLLTLRGGLARPFRVSELVALITGEEAAKSSLDFVVSRLSVIYRTELAGGQESGNSLGTPRYFEFLCAIAFEWGDQNQIASSFHLQWEKEVYRFWITAGITLFECFEFAASCQVAIEGGEASFQNFQFMTKIRSIEITASYDAQKNFTFRVINFNLGELIEGLISLIAPDHNWYLPWPFGILKQITLKELEVVMDRQEENIRARYKINLKILFLTVECIELFYDYGNGDFLVNVITNASVGGDGEGRNVITNVSPGGDGEGRNVITNVSPGGDGEGRNLITNVSAGDGGEGRNVSGWEEDHQEDRRSDEGETYGLNLLKDTFPVIRGAGDRLFSLKYLGIGQHIQVKIPESFEETEFPQVLENMKKTIRKGGRPGLDMNHNWVAALQLQLINAVDITLLMCDPVFYGLQVDIGKGSELVEQLAGLSFTILYSKVTETIGMFYARLKFPEAFRKIELGAIQIFLGEIGVWVYTNGNFKIDMGFPHNRDFSNSFGLTYLFFTGKGGFYFGMLNGDTSRAVPQVSRGHFEVVVELGIGISAGVGREISAGPLKAGAYVMLTAIFEGVLANYVPDGEGQKDSIYYKVKALAGVTASIYGSVDFVLIQIGFSVNLSFLTDLVLESYQPAELSVEMSLSVDAYIKILFIKISFSFSFAWKDKFILGNKKVAPWEIENPVRQAELLVEIPSYEIQWYDGAVASEMQELCAEIIYYITFDEPEPGKECSGKRKIAFLALLHGMAEETCLKLGYENRLDTPFARLAEICFRRALLSVRVAGQERDGLPAAGGGETSSVRAREQELMVDRQLLEYLSEYLSRTESFEEGFSFEELNRFLACNVRFSYIKSSVAEADEENAQIDGIPFPLWPQMELTWFSAPDTTVTRDLEEEPLVGEHFFAEMEAYYRELAMWNPSDRVYSYGKNRKAGGTSVSEFMFAQYFYMLTRILVSLASDRIGDAQMSLDQAAEWVRDVENLEKAAGMIARFSYGGSRAYVDGEGTKSMYDFAGQEFAGLDPEAFSDTDVIHRMSMRVKEEEPSGFRDSLPQIPEIGLYHRTFGEPVLQGRNRTGRDGQGGNGSDREDQSGIHTDGDGQGGNGSDRDGQGGNGSDRDGQSGIRTDGNGQGGNGSDRVGQGEIRTDGDRRENLEWSFTKAELVYPGGGLQMSHKPEVMPFYRRQPKTLELKNPQGLLKQEDTSFWEIQSRAGGDFCIVTYENEEPLEHPFERGILLRIPIKANENDIFEIEPPGYSLIQKLTVILQDQAVSITPYRYTNELDSDHCGFACVDEKIFLYRHNLCLEAEKPQLRKFRAQTADGGTEEKEYENSAWLTETTQFLSLLKDAAMVNARGYYVKFHLEERQILEDGRMTLLLWVRTKDQAEEIKIIQEGITRESHPVLLTEEEISVYACQPGTFAFSLDEEENGSEIQEQYQMLGYQILENPFFAASNESRPVIAQKMKNGNGFGRAVQEVGTGIGSDWAVQESRTGNGSDWAVQESRTGNGSDWAVQEAGTGNGLGQAGKETGKGIGSDWAVQDAGISSGYSQIVPAYCYAKEGKDTPYGGISPGSSLKMDFRLIDLLGNRSASGITWEIPYGYTDPLLPISVYPHTKCVYELERAAEGYSCFVTFSYVEEDDKEWLQDESEKSIEDRLRAESKKNNENRLLAESEKSIEDRLRDESEKGSGNRLQDESEKGSGNRLQDESEGSNENLLLACRQLECEDMRCFIDLCGTEMQVDKAPLLAYVQGLCQGEVPEAAVYELPFAGGEDILELKVAFLLKRDEQLLSAALKGTEEAAEVLTARSDITENTEKINQDYLAVRGLDGQLFYVPPVKHTFDGYEIWTLQPLSNKLLQLKEIPVVDQSGTTQRISYYQVDLEEWAADFLMDLEGFLKPDSIYGEDRDVCEMLLEIKKNLAQVIASGVTKISGNVGNPQFEQVAEEYYQNLMLQNLSAGRETDGVILLQSEKEADGVLLQQSEKETDRGPLQQFKKQADMRKAWCFRAESDRDGFTLKPGKLRADGILPVGVCAADISKQMRVDMDLRLTFTDWEIAGEYFYEFLTVQEQNSVLWNIKGNLPYKRFPQMPVLKSQEYAGEEAACRWKYEVAFVHQTAEQDILTLRLLPKSEARLRNADDRFLHAMVQYRYLRDKLLVDTSMKKQLVECCRNICESWSYERLSMRAGTGAAEWKLRFSLAFEERKLVILESDIAPEKLKISMKTPGGEYGELNRGEGDFYILPEELAEPYEFLISVLDLDIREVNRINACISVTRNQEIAEINDLFLYRSDEAAFVDDLLPSLNRPETVELGDFEKENFISRLCGLCGGFGKASMEVCCKAPVSVYGEETIYSSLPVLYAPDIAADGRKDVITLIYDRIEAWMKERFGGREGELTVQVQLALFAAEDQKRNLMEFADLEFRCRK